MAEGIPRHVERFIGRYIVSVEQLEILLLLRRNAEKDWSPEEVARELATSSDSAVVRLSDLREAGLVAAVGRQFRYEPSSNDLRQAVDDLADSYGRRRVTVIGLIFAKPPDAIRSFAEAFRLKEE